MDDPIIMTFRRPFGVLQAEREAEREALLVRILREERLREEAIIREANRHRRAEALAEREEEASRLYRLNFGRGFWSLS